MIDFKKIGISRNELMFQLKKRNIGSQVHYIPVPMHPYYKKKTSLSNIKNAKNYYENCLSIPIYYDLKERDLIISIITGLLLGFLLFPSPDFSKSILVGGLLPFDLFPQIVSGSLLFWSFLSATVGPAIVIMSYDSFKR